MRGKISLGNCLSVDSLLEASFPHNRLKTVAHTGPGEGWLGHLPRAFCGPRCHEGLLWSMFHNNTLGCVDRSVFSFSQCSPPLWGFRGNGGGGQGGELLGRAVVLSCALLKKLLWL